jgi:hypothetical protein
MLLPPSIHSALLAQIPRDTPSSSATPPLDHDIYEHEDVYNVEEAHKLAGWSIEQLECTTHPAPPGNRVTKLSFVTNPVAYLSKYVILCRGLTMDSIRYIHYAPRGGASAPSLCKLLRGLAKRERMRCIVLIRETEYVRKTFEGILSRARSVMNDAGVTGAEGGDAVVPVDGVLVPPNVHIFFWKEYD